MLADLPAGRGVLEVSLIGYALVRRDVDVPAGGTLELTLPLAEGTGTYTEDVEVTAATATRETGVASQITIGSADIEELRSTLTEDPMRAVQTLAGVGGSDDYRSDFSIRAAPFDHLSVTLDGIPSSLLVHTVRQARDTGSLAMLNSDILEGASVLFGSYAAALRQPHRLAGRLPDARGLAGAPPVSRRGQRDRGVGGGRRPARRRPARLLAGDRPQELHRLADPPHRSGNDRAPSGSSTPRRRPSTT